MKLSSSEVPDLSNMNACTREDNVGGEGMASKQVVIAVVERQCRVYQGIALTGAEIVDESGTRACYLGTRPILPSREFTLSQSIDRDNFTCDKATCGR